MAVSWFGGPMAGVSAGTPQYDQRRQQISSLIAGAFAPQTPAVRRSGPYSTGYMGAAGLVGPSASRAAEQRAGGQEQVRTAAPGSIRTGADVRERLMTSSSNLLNRRTVPGGGTGTPTAPIAPGAPSGRNPNEDLLNRQLRRLAAMRQAADTQVVQEGATRGMWRSQTPQLEENRQRQTEASQDAWQRFLAGEFENQRATAADERRLAFEREKLQQELELERQRAQWERQLQEQRLGAASQQSAADRQSDLVRSLLGGEGGSTRILSSTTQGRMARENAGPAQAPQTGGGLIAPTPAAPAAPQGGIPGLGEQNMLWDPYRGWVRGAGFSR